MRQSASAVIRFPRFRAARIGALAISAAILSACASSPPPGGGSSASSGGGATQTTEQRRAALIDPNGPVVIALIAPTTATSKAAARAAQDLVAAAQIAMSERAPANLAMKIYDSKGTPGGAAEATAHAVREGAALIIGPLLGDGTAAAGPVAAAAGLTMLSFSNDASVAGGNVWVLGQLPGDEMRRVLSYAGSQGIGQVALVRPADRYGDAVAAEASGAGRDAGVSISPTVSYERSFTGIEATSKSVAGDIRASGAGGVLLADSGDALRAMASFLAYYDLSPRQVRYMGLSRWDDPRNASESPLHGGWFSAADSSRTAAFKSTFAAQLSREPSALASMGYDAVVVAADLLRGARPGDAVYSGAALTRNVFEGASGSFRLTADGLNRRSLAVMEMTAGGPVVLDPAPTAAPGA
ncbi:MAG: penicillin-binding protein activator [Paracoccaceae bacterium]